MGTQIKVLFLCTGNACRSQMAEALLRHAGGERFEALSAGSHPAGFVHPLATMAMDRLGVPMVAPRSKSWDEFAHATVDVVITLCDSAAAETCPTWPGAPITAHWPHPDPVAMDGGHDERLAFALKVAGELKRRIERLVAIDFDAVAHESLVAGIRNIGNS